MIFYNKQIFERCFPYGKKHFYKNIKYVPTYISSIHFLIKNGYDKCACWETSDWFVITMKAILKRYKENRHGSPVVIDNFFDVHSPEELKHLENKNEEEWDNILNKMLNLLNKMELCSDISNCSDVNNDCAKCEKRAEQAKDEFFKLFSKYFYHLWD